MVADKLGTLHETTPYTLCVGVTSHMKAIVDKNLRLSPDVQSGGLRLEEEYNAPSAGAGYNSILDRSSEDIVIFAHHDVYFPAGWLSLLNERLNELQQHDTEWAVLAPFGIGKQDNQFYGPLWSSSLGSIIGRVALAPIETSSIDEAVIIVRRGSGLRFDETLPGFHLYGSDIVHSAMQRNMKSYVMALPLVHNDGFKPFLDQSFEDAFNHQHRKWRDHLPISTPVTKITRYKLSFFRNQLKNKRSLDIRQKLAVTTNEHPENYALLCGWGDLSASTKKNTK